MEYRDRSAKKNKVRTKFKTTRNAPVLFKIIIRVEKSWMLKLLGKSLTIALIQRLKGTKKEEM